MRTARLTLTLHRVRSHLNLTIMARLTGFSGGMTGKVGSVIFRQRQGVTIAAQYQPMVKNPNSEGQRAQRAGFKLMSQLSSIMAPALGGFNTATAASKKGTLSQRNAFFKRNYEFVDIASEGKDVVAKIKMEQLKLTDSFTNPGILDLSQASSGSYLKITVDSSPAQRIKLAVIGYEKSSGIGISERPERARLINTFDISTENGKMSVDFAMTPEQLHDAGLTNQLTVLAYGIMPTTTATRVTLDNIHTPELESYFSAVRLGTLVSTGEVVVTDTIGANFKLVS